MSEPKDEEADKADAREATDRAPTFAGLFQDTPTAPWLIEARTAPKPLSRSHTSTTASPTTSCLTSSCVSSRRQGCLLL